MKLYFSASKKVAHVLQESASNNTSTSAESPETLSRQPAAARGPPTFHEKFSPEENGSCAEKSQVLFCLAARSLTPPPPRKLFSLGNRQAGEGSFE